jgi:hypothetical protein
VLARSSFLSPRPDARRALSFSQIVHAAACQKSWLDRVRSANRARVRRAAMVRCQKTNWWCEAFLAPFAPSLLVDAAGDSHAALLLNQGIHELVCIHRELFVLVRLSNSIFAPRLVSIRPRFCTFCSLHKLILHNH